VHAAGSPDLDVLSLIVHAADLPPTIPAVI